MKTVKHGYRGAIAREIEGAKDNKHMIARGAFRVFKLGNKIIADYRRPQFILDPVHAKQGNGILAAFILVGEEWVEVKSQAEVDAILAARAAATVLANGKTYDEVKAKLVEHIKSLEDRADEIAAKREG